ncbi:hypothetical protein OHA84_30600 [Streptomyces sp. NBC_00513]|uniref:hypothetical protein n=1 Tax=unclassified Streptomyces TaxID=2593676 RepID=UPI00224FD3C6|nr:hypothetical protein [Streptomyces sp. NBC_00424]MCX5072134.1 hypothetical protein [Streptomyces sp. NBC_00424]WUD44506.1 hypothetical protein OHA84_30600 [Streptomyces sp. NBC_00513]
MLKPTRTILALATGGLVLGLVGAGTAIADEGPMDDMSGHEKVILDGHDDYDDGDYDRPRHAWGKVVSRGPLKVRSKPSTRAYVLGKVKPHRKLALECKTRGERVDGNNIWYLLADRDRENVNDGMNGDEDLTERMNHKDRKDRWVSARYVDNLSPVEWCRN